jgi:hypothetical protein
MKRREFITFLGGVARRRTGFFQGREMGAGVSHQFITKA